MSSADFWKKEGWGLNDIYNSVLGWGELLGAADSPSKLQHHPCPKRCVDDLDPSCLCPISPKKEPGETWISVTSGRACIRELCFLRAHSSKGILNNSCKLSQSPHWNLSRRNQDVGKFERFCWQMFNNVGSPSSPCSLKGKFISLNKSQSTVCQCNEK